MTLPTAQPFKVTKDGREICPVRTKSGKAEYFRRLYEMAERQGGGCAICSIRYASLYFDHEAGRGANGAHRDDRIIVDGHWQNAALCYGCNMHKGSQRYHWVNNEYVPAKPAREL
jgi:hypothetical protein